MPDLLRFGVAAFEEGRSDEAGRLLAFLDRCLSDGDEVVTNAVAVSFVEDYGYWPNQSDRFLKNWPAGVRVELGR